MVVLADDALANRQLGGDLGADWSWFRGSLFVCIFPSVSVPCAGLMRPEHQKPARQAIGRQAAEGRMHKVKEPRRHAKAIGEGSWRRWRVENRQRAPSSGQLALRYRPTLAEFGPGLFDFSRGGVDLCLQ